MIKQDSNLGADLSGSVSFIVILFVLLTYLISFTFGFQFHSLYKKNGKMFIFRLINTRFSCQGKKTAEKPQ